MHRHCAAGLVGTEPRHPPQPFWCTPCRAVYALFLKQMELGRLTLPEDDVAQPSSGHSPSAEAVQADPALIARLVGAGQPEAEQDPSSLNRERLQVGQSSQRG